VKDLHFGNTGDVADYQFLDDLSAASRFKTFLVGTGAKVPDDILKGLATLVAVFSDDLSEFENSSGLGDSKRQHDGFAAAGALMPASPNTSNQPRESDAAVSISPRTVI
jgi:hypothetical protein